MKQEEYKAPKFDWQGHRGCRGLLPENTLPAFIKAIDLGVNTIEMDVAVSNDNKIIVSHEPWMSSKICTDPDFVPVSEDMEKQYKLFDMNLGMISIFDCGRRGNFRFPQQQSMETHKPSLEEVFTHCEKHILSKGKSKIGYNIEVKSKPEWDSIYTPTPDIFADLLVAEIKASGIEIPRFTIQSFDMRILRHMHKKHPKFTLALLIEHPYEHLSTLIDSLGFQPPILSPYYKLLDKVKINEAHQKGMRVVPWTVNEVEEVKKLIGWKIDGIITDYPNMMYK
jgi:glycerophosphoryl diester phosphodiesterase